MKTAIKNYHTKINIYFYKIIFIKIERDITMKKSFLSAILLGIAIAVFCFSTNTFAQNQQVYLNVYVQQVNCNSYQNNAEVEIWSKSTGLKVDGRL